MLPRQPKFLSNQPKNLMQPFPLPDDAIQSLTTASEWTLWLSGLSIGLAVPG